MAQYHVTIDSELLQHLFLSDAKDSSVSKLLESILNQIFFWRHKPRNNCELHHMKELKNAKATGTGLSRIL